MPSPTPPLLRGVVCAYVLLLIVSAADVFSPVTAELTSTPVTVAASSLSGPLPLDSGVVSHGDKSSSPTPVGSNSTEDAVADTNDKDTRVTPKDYPYSSSDDYPWWWSSSDDYPWWTSSSDDYPWWTSSSDDYPWWTSSSDDYPWWWSSNGYMSSWSDDGIARGTYVLSIVYDRELVTEEQLPDWVEGLLNGEFGFTGDVERLMDDLDARITFWEGKERDIDDSSSDDYPWWTSSFEDTVRRRGKKGGRDGAAAVRVARPAAGTSNGKPDDFGDAGSYYRAYLTLDGEIDAGYAFMNAINRGAYAPMLLASSPWPDDTSLLSSKAWIAGLVVACVASVGAIAFASVGVSKHQRGAQYAFHNDDPGANYDNIGQPMEERDSDDAPSAKRGPIGELYMDHDTGTHIC